MTRYAPSTDRADPLFARKGDASVLGFGGGPAETPSATITGIGGRLVRGWRIVLATATAATLLATVMTVSVRPPERTVAAPPAASPPTTAASQQAAAPAARQARKQYRVQLLAVSSAAAARRERRRLLRAHGDLLKGLRMTIASGGNGKGAKVYQLRTSGFADFKAARAFCRHARRRGMDCIVVTR